MIRLINLEKFYQNRSGKTWVLRRIHLDVEAGEFVSIMGPSGSGKSTLLGILGMLDGEWIGEFWFNGEPVHAMKPKERAKLNKLNVGFVFQSYHLLDDLTVYENLELPLSYQNVPRKERQAMVAEILDRFQIVAKKDLFPDQLSGGQQQLVAVARAVVARPKVILADEPTGNLHSSQGEAVMDLLAKLNDQGTTIIQVTHNEAFAGYGERIVHLHDGWVADEHGRPLYASAVGAESDAASASP